MTMTRIGKLDIRTGSRQNAQRKILVKFGGIYYSAKAAFSRSFLVSVQACSRLTVCDIFNGRAARRCPCSCAWVIGIDVTRRLGVETTKVAQTGSRASHETETVRLRNEINDNDRRSPIFGPWRGELLQICLDLIRRLSCSPPLFFSIVACIFGFLFLLRT